MIELLNCDAGALLSYAPDADFLFCDPPYSKHVHESATSQSARGGARQRELGFAHITPELRENIVQAAAWAPRWSLVYTDVESIGRWQDAGERMGVQYIRAIPWIRWSMPNLTGTLPPQGWEAVCVFHARKGRKHWNGRGNLLALEHEAETFYPEVAALRHKAERGTKKVKHATAKPLDQVLDLISWFSDPGELVVDLTAGRGTAAVACVLLGRRFLGAEIDPGEHALALQRIEGVHRGTLSERDLERVARWAESVTSERTEGFTAPSLERAARRRADVDRVIAALNV